MPSTRKPDAYNATPPETVETIKRMWFEGVTSSKIAETVGLTRNAIIGHVNRNRWHRPLGVGKAPSIPRRTEEEKTNMVKRNRTDPAKIETMRLMWDKGFSPAQIGEVHGLSRNAVTGHAHRQGWPLREAVIPASVSKRNSGLYVGAVRAIARKKEEAKLQAESVRKYGVAGNGAVFEVANERPPHVKVRDIGAVAASKGLRIIDDGFGGCRWPISAPANGRGEETLFCCAPRPTGETYCEDHHTVSVAQRPVKDISKMNPDARGARRVVSRGPFLADRIGGR